MPRCSCPYAGTTRIRFEGLPRPIFSGRRRLSPLPGHPLDAAIIRRVSPGASRLRLWRYAETLGAAFDVVLAIGDDEHEGGSPC